MRNDIYKKIRIGIIIVARVLLFLDLFERIELRIYLDRVSLYLCLSGAEIKKHQSPLLHT